MWFWSIEGVGLAERGPPFAPQPAISESFVRSCEALARRNKQGDSR
jgi:hypothetical protein